MCCTRIVKLGQLISCFIDNKPKKFCVVSRLAHKSSPDFFQLCSWIQALNNRPWTRSRSKGYKWNVEYTGNNRLKAVLKYPAYSLFRRYEKSVNCATREFVLNYTFTEHDWWPVTGQWFYWLTWNAWQITPEAIWRYGGHSQETGFRAGGFSLAPSTHSP